MVNVDFPVKCQFQSKASEKSIMRYLYGLIVALVFLNVVSPVSAQTSPEEVRKFLGGPVDIEQGALFAATRSSLKGLCGKIPEFEWHAAIINRLHYGSLEPDQKLVFKQIMAMQMSSNQTIYLGFNDQNRAAFCDEANRTITSMAADFVRARPDHCCCLCAGTADRKSNTAGRG